jgi:hypothetical protein
VERPLTATPETKVIHSSWGWTFDYTKDQSQLFEEPTGYEYINNKKDMDILGAGVALRSIVSAESNAAKTKPAYSVGSVLLNVGRASVLHDDKRSNEDATAFYFPESFVFGLSANGELCLANDYFAAYTLKYVFSILDNQDIIYTSKATPTAFYPNKVSGHWLANNWNLKLGRIIFDNFKISFGYEKLIYSGDLNYKYKEFTYLDPNASRHIFEVGNEGCIAELGWKRERMSLNLSYRIPNGIKGIGGYSMSVQYFI